MNQMKLYKKMFDRIGSTVFVKDTMKPGTMTSFRVEPEGVYYTVMMDTVDGMTTIKEVHESNIIVMKGTAL